MTRGQDLYLFQQITTALGPPPAVTPPNAVTALTPGTATTTTQPLSWTAPTTGTAPISYLVEYRQTGASSYAIASSTTSSSCTVTGLSASTAYDYRVTPSNSAGNGAAGLLGNVSTAAAAAPGSTKPRFAYGPTNASGTASVFNSFFGSATEFSGSSNGGKAGTLTSAANSATYTWLFIPASADASGIVVTDPSSFHGGFSGATYGGINGDGDPADPIIVRQNYTDATGFAWHAYRSNGKSAAASYTVS